MLRLLLRPSLPPLLAVAGGCAVFLVVLGATPPGFSAVPELFGPSRGLNSLPGAYAVGAAATLGLVALLFLGLILWLVQTIFVICFFRNATGRITHR